MTISLPEWRADATYFTVEGRQIAYWTHGTGKPLLLVHGYPTSSWDWTPIWNLMDGAKHRLIAADMLGFGLSDKPREDYSIHRQADLQQALLDHLEITKYDALVHDYGVSVGQEMLARQAEGSGATGPDRMVFLNGGIFPRQHRAFPLLQLAGSPLGPLISMMMTRRRIERSYAATFGSRTKLGAQNIDIFWTLICENRGRPILHRLLHYFDDRQEHEERWIDALERAQDRIGLINGASDPVCGEHVFNEWVERLPNANAYLLPDIGHYPQVEAPEQTAQVALQWLS